MANQKYRDAIASIESRGSGDYSAVGPNNPKMGRALGRYQIMEANIGPWSQAALGRQITPDQFMADPALQDAIFDHKFGGYVNQYGPEGAAQAWFAGPGGVGKTKRKDVLGTNVGSYGQKFMSALGAPPMSQPSPTGTPEQVQQPTGIMSAFASDQTQQQPSLMGGMTEMAKGNYLDGAGQMFGSMSAGSGQQQAPQAPAMQLAPVQGPSSQQATALANYVQSLLGKKVSNG